MRKWIWKTGRKPDYHFPLPLLFSFSTLATPCGFFNEVALCSFDNLRARINYGNINCESRLILPWTIHGYHNIGKYKRGKGAFLKNITLRGVTDLGSHRGVRKNSLKSEWSQLRSCIDAFASRLVIKFSISFVGRWGDRVNGRKERSGPRKGMPAFIDNVQAEICQAALPLFQKAASFLDYTVGYTRRQLCKTAVLLFAPRCTVPLQRCYYSLSGRTKNPATNNVLPPRNYNNSSWRPVSTRAATNETAILEWPHHAFQRPPLHLPPVNAIKSIFLRKNAYQQWNKKKKSIQRIDEMKRYNSTYLPTSFCRRRNSGLRTLVTRFRLRKC